MNEQEPKKRNTRPVVTYILILFTAAFFIMAFSLVANQRSNDQTLDELRSSISSLEEGQTAQDHVMTLQEKQSELEQSLLVLQDELDDLQQEMDTQTQAYEALQGQYQALLSLHNLEMQLAEEDYTACLTIMQTMETDGLIALLPATGDAPTPAARFAEIKLIVLNT